MIKYLVISTSFIVTLYALASWSSFLPVSIELSYNGDVAEASSLPRSSSFNRTRMTFLIAPHALMASPLFLSCLLNSNFMLIDLVRVIELITSMITLIRAASESSAIQFAITKKH